MSKVVGGLFSLEARGKLGKSINYSNWCGITRVKRNVKPKNPQTTTQQLNRSYLQDAIIAWNTLTAGEKAIWEGWKT